MLYINEERECYMSKKSVTRKSTLERRRAPRAKARIPVEILKDEGLIEAKTRNISASGAYCTLDKFIPLNTKVDVTLLIPEKPGKSSKKLKRVTCHGIVVRNEPAPRGEKGVKYGLALFFTDIGQSGKRKLSHYIKKKLPAHMQGKATRPVGKYDPGEVFITDISAKQGLSVSSANFRVIGEELNLGKNGICCKTDRYIPLFREIAINLVFSSNGHKRDFRVVQCSGVVVGCEKIPRTRDYDLAVYFVGLSRSDKKRLAKYVTKPSH
jgi:c-di-GMP-binding flagellar brake protein YcgR